MKKASFILLLSLVVFIYGLLVGMYKIFPFSQLLNAKHYVEYQLGTFETSTSNADEGSIETIVTAMNRLSISKIPFPGIAGGGAISTAENHLYIITGKGELHIFDLSSMQSVETNVNDVPMNFGELIQSGHPYTNDFRINWFRVNGLYAESNSDDTRHTLFVSHNAYNKDDDCISHNISKIQIPVNGSVSSSVPSWETIFTASPCIPVVPDKWVSSAPYSGHISGGKIIAYSADKILATVGDYNFHGIDGVDEYAMNRDVPYGKTLLVDKNTGSWDIYTIGHRNPSGLFAGADSTIWLIENGPEGGDELNILERGKNYGWPRESYGLWYDPTLSLSGNSAPGQHEYYKKPVFSWLPAIAPSGVIQINNKRFESWERDLIISTMRDQSLRRLRIDGDNRVLYDERIPIGHRVRDITELPSGHIAMITDDNYLIITDNAGALYDSSSNKSSAGHLSVLKQYSSMVTGSETEVTSPNTSVQIYSNKCGSCHFLNGNNSIGPHLSGLFEREIAGVDNFTYSATLQDNSQQWSPSLLKSFLLNPDKEFKGTTMQQVSLTPAEADSIVRYISNY